VDALRASGIAVWVTYPRTVRETVAFIRELGAITGAVTPATTLADEIAGLADRARTTASGRRVFYPIWRNPYMTISADTYISDVLTTIGALNVFADRTERYPTVTLDEMAARRPEIIVLPDEPFRFRRVHVKDFEGFADVPAVRDGRIHLMDGKLFSWHGPRLAEALRTLPALFA